ncbi:PQQ-like beta-propeller repeat protein [candidate division KSB1 bacterium]|nr:PQQ-like beta-propeller repeat protein [candidate division KSB1 bacterium]
MLLHKNKSPEITIDLKKIIFTGILYFFFPLLSVNTLTAQENNKWHCFHGLSRNNKSLETGLQKQWPETGPKLLWTVTGLGDGYSSVSIAENFIFTAGMVNKQTYVYAFDLNGKQIWKKPNGRSWETTMSHAMTYTGSRSTPTFDNGVVYHLNELGRLTAFDFRTGNEIWNLELRNRFDAEIPEYGYSESVYINGDFLYCNPAGKRGFMVCLNKKNGDLVWSNKDIPGTVAFSSPIVVEYGGYRQIIGMSSNCVYGADSKTGKLLWSMEYENQRDNNVTDPIFHDGTVFVSSGYGKGSMLIKLKAAGKEILPEKVWHTDLMDNHHGGIILHEGYLYGAGHNARGWFCLDFLTGKQMWNSPGKGSLTYADGMLYCLEERGTMKLVKTTADKYEQVSAFKVPRGGRGLYWAHPVVCGGRLYVRHSDKLYAYKIK